MLKHLPRMPFHTVGELHIAMLMSLHHMFHTERFRKGRQQTVLVRRSKPNLPFPQTRASRIDVAPVNRFVPRAIPSANPFRMS